MCNYMIIYIYIYLCIYMCMVTGDGIYLYLWHCFTMVLSTFFVQGMNARPANACQMPGGPAGCDG